MSNLITPANLGAWLIKCDPDHVFDLKQFMADGGENLRTWSVVDNYRSKMMRPGDKVVFWVSGSGANVARGVWGVGHLTGRVQDVDPDDMDAADPGYWLDEEARKKVEFEVPVDVMLFDEAVTPEALDLAGISDLEVQKMPGGSNPSWGHSGTT